MVLGNYLIVAAVSWPWVFGAGFVLIAAIALFLAMVGPPAPPDFSGKSGKENEHNSDCATVRDFPDSINFSEVTSEPEYPML